MFLIARASIALLLTVTATTSAPPTGLDDKQNALVTWAYARFEDAGLGLGEVTISFPEADDACGGADGTYRPSTNNIWICTATKDTVLHEYAHAWLESNLDDGDRRGFLELRGLESWNDRDASWYRRGAEQAAEVLKSALWENNRLVRWVETSPNGAQAARYRLLWLTDSSPDRLFAAYETLTGGLPARRSADDPRLSTTAVEFSPEARR
jgi:hypothetical protein